MATKKILADLELDGSITSSTFNVGSSVSYIRHNAGDTELFADSSLSIESGDGMLISITDVIDITGGGEITADGSIEAVSFIKTGGTSSQFLKADGSVDSSTYLTSGDVTSSQWDAATGGINYAGGNVGIGTTNPATKLDVMGDITITNANGSNPTDAGSLYFTESAGVWGSTQYGFRINQQGTSNYLNFQSANTTTVRDILTLARDTGNVGIGTTSPSEKLEVDGNVKLEDNNKLLLGTSSDLQVYHDGSNSYIDDTGTGHLNIRATNLQLLNAVGNKYYLTGSDGNDVKIFYNGSEKFATTNTGVDITGDAKADSFIKDGGASTEFLKADGSVDTNTYLTSADVTDSQWDDITGGINYGSGNVGIGTTDPQAKLDVNGGIRMGDDTTTASADNEGTMRYYTDDDGSYVDICMATLDSGYSGSDYHWINIVRNIFPA